MSSVISVENLSKLYRLGEVGTGSLAHDVNRWWHRKWGKEDPYAQVGHVNDRTRKSQVDWVYALKDINFKVNQGEVLGIIGSNGAGKSTLLKILARVTAPTSGVVNVKGRIASLLEVGTGFHSELTGRDNIYLNGAILGMKRREIDSKLDQIVDFSGCAAYLNTPVKRYSSGMTVRLAFAVAAHLEPEILIVDEVLAVGDAEFQKKCLGKMREQSTLSGRTILFVSHDLKAIRAICDRTLLLKHGSVVCDESTETCLRAYIQHSDQQTSKGQVYLDGRGISLKGTQCSYQLNESGAAALKFLVQISVDVTPVEFFVDIALESQFSSRVVQHISRYYHDITRVERSSVVSFLFETATPPLPPGDYFLTVYVYERLGVPILHLTQIFAFNVPVYSGGGDAGTSGFTASICPPFRLSVIKE